MGLRKEEIWAVGVAWEEEMRVRGGAEGSYWDGEIGKRIEEGRSMGRDRPIEVSVIIYKPPFTISLDR